MIAFLLMAFFFASACFGWQIRGRVELYRAERECRLIRRTEAAIKYREAVARMERKDTWHIDACDDEDALRRFHFRARIIQPGSWS
jgi:hypothetical protein